MYFHVELTEYQMNYGILVSREEKEHTPYYKAPCTEYQEIR
jgi:hypothetical protein